MVAGTHCRGEDRAFFPPGRIFSTTNVYICSENATHIGGFYFMRLGYFVLFMFTSVGECKVIAAKETNPHQEFRGATRLEPGDVPQRTLRSRE